PPDRSGERPATEGGQVGQDNLGAAGRSLLMQSRSERQSGNYAQASATLERALRIEPDQALIWLELARLRLLEENPAQAEQLGRKARALAVGDPSLEAEAAEIIDAALEDQGKVTD
ncbi:MAG: tetratricopeptide repeat protein, partial [Woeseiaceae bacterium]